MKRIKEILTKEKKLTNINIAFISLMAMLLGVSIGNVITRSLSKTDTYNQIDVVYNKILNEYYKEITEKDLQTAAVKGMMSLLTDKHSEYLTKEQTEAFDQLLDGSFDGIGVEITKNNDNKVEVVSIFENSPAAKAGIKKGDILLKINETDIKDKSLDEVVSLIKNKKKSIKIIVERDKKEKEFKIVPNSVDIPSVSSEVIENNNQKIGYIRLSIFAANSDKQFEDAYNKLKNKKITKLIIDLRDNVGGHLTTVNNITELFLGKDVPMYQIKKNKQKTVYYAKSGKNSKDEIVILINSNSASAAELLSSALREQLKATIVGTTSYGKGTVQQAMTLKDGSMIKYTTEEWLTSKGKTINEKGITPDVEIKLQDKYYESYDKKDDNQLSKAIELLTKDK